MRAHTQKLEEKSATSQHADTGFFFFFFKVLSPNFFQHEWHFESKRVPTDTFWLSRIFDVFVQAGEKSLMCLLGYCLTATKKRVFGG